jgi:Flp pilus assembly protein TadD
MPIKLFFFALLLGSMILGCQVSNPYTGLTTREQINEVPGLLAAQLRYQKAQELEKDGAWRLALVETEKAYALDSTLSGIPTSYGRLLERAGEDERASEMLQQGLAQSPRDPNAHYEVGKFLAKRKDLNKAEFHLRKAVELQPSHAEAWFELGKTLVKLDNSPGALEAFRQVQPDHEATYNVAILLIRDQKEEPARDLLQAAAMMDEKFEKPQVILARMKAPGGAGQASLIIPASMKTK